MVELQTTAEVMDALGGTSAIAKRTGRNYAAVWHWRKKGTFPATTLSVIRPALKRKGFTAPLRLWRMEQP